MRVLIYRALPAEWLADLRAAYGRLDFCQTLDAVEAAEEVARCEAAFGPVPAAAASRSASLRWVQLISAGLDGFELLARDGLVVTTAQGLHAAALAEHVVMGILAGVRRLPYFAERQRDRVWDRRVSLPSLLQGQRVGLIGYGVAGREVARRLRSFGVRLTAVKREAAPCPPELDALGTFPDLDDLLRSSDHVVVLLPLTRATRGLLDARRISAIKRGAWLHNVARGGLIDEEALRLRLQDGTLSGATLDVFASEPLPPDNPWWTTPNTAITPHLAGHHDGLPEAIFRRFCENLERYLRGEPLAHRADFARGY